MINIFEDLHCQNIENILLEFKDSRLKIFREENLIFVKLYRETGVLVLATGPSICVALERAESYIGGEAHFSMPNICLSTKSKLDELILDTGDYIVAECVSETSLAGKLVDKADIPIFISCSTLPFLGDFLSMMENQI